MAKTQKRTVIFMGTPEFAAIILRRLLADAALDIVAVFTQPDKKAGRGQKLSHSAVKRLAVEHDLPIFQPAGLTSPEVEELFDCLNPDFLVVAAYGLLLPQKVLDCARIAAINVHASLLPAFRGAAPIQRAIIENYEPAATTGVSIMRMVASLDAGPVYKMAPVRIAGKNAQELGVALAETGAELLLETLHLLSENKLQPLEQDGSKATYAAKIQKNEGLIDWNQPAVRIDALVRGLFPWPGVRAQLHIEGQQKPFLITVMAGKPVQLETPVPCGTLVKTDSGLVVACADGGYQLDQICPQGRKPMSSLDFANGQCRNKKGVCGNVSCPV